MAAPAKVLRFFWWNLQAFAHFEESRAGEVLWPFVPEEYAAKQERIERALTSLFGKDPPDILAFAEITNKAAVELRDRLFPTYEVSSLDRLARAELQVAFVYRKDNRFREQSPMVVPDMPRGTRPIGILEFRFSKQRIRLYACHWTSRFSEASKHSRADLARYLNAEMYRYLHENPSTSYMRNVLILGDLNEEPYDPAVEVRLYAFRDRAHAQKVPHYTDRDMKRARLYNCSWRMLGERHPHRGIAGEGHAAGTYYWRKQNSWHTFDQVIVSGSLLTGEVPFLDESKLSVVVHPTLLEKDNLPCKFQWNNGKPIGVSDHLPIQGEIVLQR